MKYVLYRRVSTKEQGHSGVGLNVQSEQMHKYVSSVGGSVVGEYTDVQSGKQDTREGLAQAFRACKAHKATLLVSKLCRLSRSFSYTAKLLDGDTPIVCVESPDAPALLLRIRAVINQEERERISMRTREGIQFKIKEGKEWGDKELWKKAKNQDTTPATKARVERSLGFKEYIMGIIRNNFGESLPSLNDMANWLNEAGYTTPRGGEWTKAAVSRVVRG